MRYTKFFLLFITANLLAQKPVEQLYIPWGNNAENVQYRIEPGAKFGPQSFAVNGDAIQILDPVNNAIKNFRSNQLINQIYAPTTAKDFLIVNDDETHFIVGNEIHEYSGKTLNQQHRNPEKFASFEKIRRINGETVAQNSNSNFWIIVKAKVSSLFKTTTIIPDEGHVKLTSKTSAEIRLSSASSQQTVIVNHNNPNLASMQYLGFDENQHIYVDVNIITTQVPLQVNREIWILNPAGEKLGDIALPNHYFTQIHRDIIVTKNSQIYHMISSEDGIHIFRWDIPEPVVNFHGDYPEKYKKKTDSHTDIEDNDAIINFLPSDTKTTITREEALQIADTYVQHTWECKSSNMTNGTVTAPDGDLVRTPDWVKLGTNQKIPYKWGGFDLLSAYDNGMANGHYAGDTHTSGVSLYARGVDCSGYVSRCWGLNTHYSTRMMDDPAYGPLVISYNDWSELQPGDAIHKHGHVILFVKHNDNGSLQCVEAAASNTDWKVDYSTHFPYSLTEYSPVYYKNMDGAVLPEPAYVTLQCKDENTIEVQFSAVESATEYLVIYGTDPDDLTESQTLTNNSIEVTGLTPNVPYYFHVKAKNDEKASIISNEVYAAIPSNNNDEILIVNGFDRSTNTRHDYVTKYITPILQAGKGFSYALNESVYAGKISLLDYKSVIWILGDESSGDDTFNPTEQDLVEAFLQQGGNLFVTGSEIGWDLEGKSNHPTTADKAFYHDFLKATYYADSPFDKQGEYYTADSYSEGIFSEIGEVTFDDGSQGTINVDWPDAIKCTNGSEICFTFKDVAASNGVAGIQFSGLFPDGTKDGRLVYLSFPFETIYPESKRIEIMAKVLDYFDANTGVEDFQNAEIISEFQLNQNYPNPFNPTTKISYRLPQEGFVELSLFDLQGRLIETLINKKTNAGYHDITWNASDLSSGVYIYSIKVMDSGKLVFSENKKCILMK